MTHVHGMLSPSLTRKLGVDAAGDGPVIPRPRPWRNNGTSLAIAGAVGSFSVFVLALLGEVPAVAGLVAAVGLGLLAAPVASRLTRGQAEAVDGDERYRALFDPLPLGTLVVRAVDLELVYVSPEAERLLGIPRRTTHAIGDLWSARLHELDRSRVLEAWHVWLCGTRSEPFRSEYRLVGAERRDVCVDDVTFFVPGEDGTPATLRRHFLDVTHRRRLEEQLRQAQRLELLGRVAAGVAHDFNNLLAVISGYAARLSTSPPREVREESSDAISAAAERGASLVRQLLAFSRPQPTDSRVVNLNDLVWQFAPMLRRVIGEDVEFELRLDEHPLPVDVQPVQIDQVLMNVVVNARDAMPDGGRLKIRTWKLKGGAVLTVADTGVGIDPAIQNQIFDPFFSTKDPAKGSGLGLATAQRILHQAGGSLAVSSSPGEGTTFTVSLPLADRDEPAHVDAVDDLTAPHGGAETVLVVEDEPALRELESLMLADAGYHVLTAAKADEALVVAAENAVDLLVVDVVMPGMSGPQLVEELAARGSDVPVVFISGYGADEVSNRGLLAANAALIEKPFQAERLLRRVREVLDGAAQVVPRADAAD